MTRAGITIELFIFEADIRTRECLWKSETAGVIKLTRRGGHMATAQVETMGLMKDLVTFIAQTLVDDPEMVSVNEVFSGQTMVLELHVAKTDIGKVIGRQGRTANALRTILNAAAAKERKRTLLEIVG
jgi:hypothetical protein